MKNLKMTNIVKNIIRENVTDIIYERIPDEMRTAYNIEVNVTDDDVSVNVSLNDENINKLEPNLARVIRDTGFKIDITYPEFMDYEYINFVPAIESFPDLRENYIEDINFGCSAGTCFENISETARYIKELSDCLYSLTNDEVFIQKNFDDLSMELFQDFDKFTNVPEEFSDDCTRYQMAGKMLVFEKRGDTWDYVKTCSWNEAESICDGNDKYEYMEAYDYCYACANNHPLEGEMELELE